MVRVAFRDLVRCERLETMSKELENIKGIVEKFNLQDRKWKSERTIIYSDNGSHEINHPLSDRVEFELINEKLYIVEVIKNISFYNGEEIVSYSDDNKHCLDEIIEHGVDVGFDYVSPTDKPATIFITYNYKNKKLLEWSIVENL